MNDKSTDKIHSTLMGSLLILIATPLVFGQWLLFNGEFGPGKAIIFVIAMLLFGSMFLF